MSLAILCSGQGGQHASMFDLFADEREAGADLSIARASECARFDLVAAAKTASLFDNAIAQPLICAYQGVVWSLLASRLDAAGAGPSCIAGYSIGELASYACAGSLSWADTIALARCRAAAMDAACGSEQGLLAVRGLTRAKLAAIGMIDDVSIAIVNGDDHLIVGGSDAALAALASEATARGASTQRLPVAIAAHTPLMRDAVEPFRAELERRAWKAPRVPVLAGIDGSAVRNTVTAIEVLSRQLAETVRWSDCMDALHERRVSHCLELGPGNALARMIRERHADIEARAVADFRSLDAVVDWVVRAAR